MKLDYLALQNYRRFRSVELKIPEGVVGILGNNGAGKSTLMEAVAWALYGNKSTIARTGKDSIRNMNASSNEAVIVELVFTLDGQIYEVRREMRGSTLVPKAEVRCDGVVEAEGAEDADAYIIQLLGLDYQGFFASVFAKQNELNAFSSEYLSDRQNLIIRMLGIDALDKVLRGLGGDIREQGARLEESRKLIFDASGRSRRELLEEELKGTVEKKEALTKEIGQRKRDLLRYEKEVRELRDRYSRSKEKKRKFEALNTKVRIGKETLGRKEKRTARLEEEITGLKEHLKEVDGLRDRLKELPVIESKLEKLEKLKERTGAKKEVERRLSKIEGKKDECVRELRELRISSDKADIINKKRELENELEKIRESIGEAGTKMAVLRQKDRRLHRDISKYEDRLTELEELGTKSECPTCERPLGDTYPQLLDKYSSKIAEKREGLVTCQSNIREAEAKIAEERKEREGIEKELSSLIEKVKEIERKERERSVVIERLRAVKDQLEDRKEELSRRRREIEEIGMGDYDGSRHRKVSERYKALRSVERRKRELEKKTYRLPKLKEELEREEGEKRELKKELGALSKERGLLGFEREEHEELKAEKKTLEKRCRELEKSIGRSELKRETYSEKAGELRGRIEEVAAFEEERDELEESIRYSKRLKGLMKDFKLRMISRIRPVLSQIASDYLSQLTNGRYSRIEVNENYEIHIYDGGKTYPVERFSGGEVDIANLSLRLAISSIIAATKKKHGIRFVVLDEIFGSQDSERRRNIIQAIGQLLKRFSQVFIITHIEQVRDHIGNIILVDQVEGGNSVIRSAEEGGGVSPGNVGGSRLPVQ